MRKETHPNRKTVVLLGGNKLSNLLPLSLDGRPVGCAGRSKLVFGDSLELDGVFGRLGHKETTSKDTLRIAKRRGNWAAWWR